MLHRRRPLARLASIRHIGAAALAGVLAVGAPAAEAQRRKPKAPAAAPEPAAAPAATPTAAPAADAAAARPAPGDAIRLEAVLAAAVKQSPTLASASIDVEVARAEVIAASGIQDWLLTAAASYARNREPTVPGEVTASSSERLAGELGISKLLPTGGTFGVFTSLDRGETSFSLDGNTVDSEKYSADVVATLDQPLLRGFGSQVTYAARTQAEHAARAAELTRRAAAQDLIRDLVSAYWEVAYAQADLAIRRSSLDLARERRRLTEASVRLGQVAPTETVAVDQIIATREEEILSAELAIAESSLSLRRLAGLEIDAAKVELAPAEPLVVETAVPVAETVVGQTIQASPELAALAARGEGARLEVEVGENGTLPRLDLSLAFGPLGAAGTVGDAYRGLRELDGYTASGSLRFEQPLGNRAAEGRTRAARASLRRVSVDERALRLELALAAVRAVRLADSARQRMALSQRAIELSEKNVKAETGRFELGKSTNFDVLERQEELKQARLRQARASVDYLKARAIIDALSGEILEKYGVTLGD